MLTYLFQSLIELLYMYKLSFLYKIHIVFLLGALTLHIYCLKKEKAILDLEVNPPQSNCSKKIDYVDYQRTIKQNTAEELLKLQNSEEYRNYERMKRNPNSKFFPGNQSDLDDEDRIVFSDEEEDEYSVRNRKFKPKIY